MRGDLQVPKSRIGHAVEMVIEDYSAGGGVVFTGDFKSTSTICKEGSLMGVDENGVYHLTKTGRLRVAAASGDIQLKICKNRHEFKVEDIVINTSKTGTSRAIQSIDEDASDDYDILNVEAALGVALSLGEVLVQVAASGASGSAAELLYSPVGITIDPVNLLAENTGSSLVVRGRVCEGQMPQPIDSNIMALLPLIRVV